MLDPSAKILLRADSLRGVCDAVNRSQCGTRQHPTDSKCSKDDKTTADNQDESQCVERLFAFGNRSGDLGDAVDIALRLKRFAVNEYRLILKLCGFKPVRSTLHRVQSGIAERECSAQVRRTRNDSPIRAAQLGPPARQGAVRAGKITARWSTTVMLWEMALGIDKAIGLAHQVRLDVAKRDLRLGNVQHGTERDQRKRQDRAV